MWCINCGTKLPDEAKFCFQCGAKVVKCDSDKKVEELYELDEDDYEDDEFIDDSQDLSPEKANNKGKITVIDNDVELNILGRKCRYKDSDRTYAVIEKTYSNLIEEAKKNFTNKFDNQYKSLSSLIDNAEDDFNKEIYKGIMILKEYIVSVSGQDVDFQELYEALSQECYEFSKIIYDAHQYYYEVMGQLDDSKSYRDQRKKYRGRWEGGGFGVSGAIKGAVTASAMNATSGAFHSLVNGIGNIANNYQANKAIDEYYNNPELKENLLTAIEEDILTLKGFVVQYFEMITEVKFNTELYTIEKLNRSIDIYNELLNDYNCKEKLEENIVEMLTSYPLDSDYYYIALKSYGDEIQGINDFAKFFSISLDSVREAIKKEKEYDEALNKKLGNARILLEKDLGDNLIYEREVINLTKDLIKNVSLAYEYFNNERLEFIYDHIEPNSEKIFNAALENYLDYHDETPLVFYNNSTSILKSEGFVITNKNFITHDKNMKRINISISGINQVSLEDKNLKVNSTVVNTSMIESDDIEIFRQIIEFTIFTIKHSKVLNNNKELVIKDKLNLKNKYFQYNNHVDRAILEKKLGQAVDIFDNTLKKNRLYNGYKDKINPVLKMDVKTIIEQYKGDNLYFIGEELTSKVINKLNNVYSTYAKEMQDSEIEYILFDNTLWGGAREGFLVTSEYIYVHNAYEDEFRIKINDIEKVLYKDDNLYIYDKKVSIIQVSNEEKYNFRNIVEYILYRIKYREMINPSDSVANGNNIETTTINKSDENKENISSSIVNEDMMKEINLIKTEFDYVAYIKKYISTTKIPKLCNRIYVNGESPSVLTKFNNALNTYLSKAPDEFPCVIYDDTLFGSAKDGFTLTSEAIHFRNCGEKPVRINYSDINSIRPDESFLIIGRNRIKLTFVNKEDMKDFAEAITEVIEVIKTIKSTCFNNI